MDGFEVSLTEAQLVLQRESGRRWRGRHPDRVKSRSLKEKAKRHALKAVDPLACLQKYWHRQRAKRKHHTGLEFTVRFEDIEWPTHCPILGLELDYTGKQFESGWSLDRLDSSKGYVPGNTFVISRKANILKSNGTAEEHRQIARWIRSQSVPLL